MKLFKSLILSMVISINCYAATAISPGASFEIGFSPNGNSLNTILQAINTAKKSIHIAAYSFTSKPIAYALLNASHRGVNIEVVADQKSNSGRYSATTFLANHHIPVRLDGNYPIFHHKFMVIDDNTLETGSFNYSQAASNKNAENVIVLYNVPKIAATYQNEWQKLWNEATPLPARY